jgi:prepilin signal peptidase PulO-like enzyme (type II secretory pathway)
MSYLCYLCLFAYSDVQHILLPVSLDFPLLIVPLIFSNVYLPWNSRSHPLLYFVLKA